MKQHFIVTVSIFANGGSAQRGIKVTAKTKEEAVRLVEISMGCQEFWIDCVEAE